jgi:hypothetical protein
MARIKDRNRWLPGGFQVLHPEAGMKEPFSGSFIECVSFEMKFRKGNPHIVQKNGWSHDAAEIEWYVDQQNVARCEAHGWSKYLYDDGVSPPVSKSENGSKKNLLANVAAGVRRHVQATKAGISVYVDWVGDSGQPVDKALAESRAAVCVKCPLNKQGGLRQWFIEKAVREIQIVFGIMQDMDVSTQFDEQLGVCEACLCPMKSKVHAPIEHIKKHLTKEAEAKLHPSCWIPKE